MADKKRCAHSWVACGRWECGNKYRCKFCGKIYRMKDRFINVKRVYNQ